MSGPPPYLLLPGTAREALSFYQHVFGGELGLNSYADFGRTDGPGEAVAHGMLRGSVTLFASDAGSDQGTLRLQGLMLSLLGTSDEATLRSWFDQLAVDGEVVEPLERRPWGDYDGQVTDRYGVPWLIGFQPESD